MSASMPYAIDLALDTDSMTPARLQLNGLPIEMGIFCLLSFYAIVECIRIM